MHVGPASEAVVPGALGVHNGWVHGRKREHGAPDAQCVGLAGGVDHLGRCAGAPIVVGSTVTGRNGDGLPLGRHLGEKGRLTRHLRLAEVGLAIPKAGADHLGSVVVSDGGEDVGNAGTVVGEHVAAWREGGNLRDVECRLTDLLVERYASAPIDLDAGDLSRNAVATLEVLDLGVAVRVYLGQGDCLTITESPLAIEGRQAVNRADLLRVYAGFPLLALLASCAAGQGLGTGICAGISAAPVPSRAVGPTAGAAVPIVYRAWVATEVDGARPGPPSTGKFSSPRTPLTAWARMEGTEGAEVAA